MRVPCILRIDDRNGGFRNRLLAHFRQAETTALERHITWRDTSFRLVRHHSVPGAVGPSTEAMSATPEALRRCPVGMRLSRRCSFPSTMSGKDSAGVSMNPLAGPMPRKQIKERAHDSETRLEPQARPITPLGLIGLFEAS